ncbi:hypothetical protein KKG72_10215 [bacterium]|nr:hypothetical protein [bacterium]MBU1995217.1 hypothetical protein [bacterium]
MSSEDAQKIAEGLGKIATSQGQSEAGKNLGNSKFFNENDPKDVEEYLDNNKGARSYTGITSKDNTNGTTLSSLPKDNSNPPNGGSKKKGSASGDGSQNEDLPVTTDQTLHTTQTDTKNTAINAPIPMTDSFNINSENSISTKPESVKTPEKQIRDINKELASIAG